MFKFIKSWFLSSDTDYVMEQGHRRNYQPTTVPFHYLPR
jgi:hypothetical protein